MGSSEFHVIRVIPGISNKLVFTLINREAIRKEAEQNMTGSSGHRRVPASFYESVLIPILKPTQQTAFVQAIEKLESNIRVAELSINSAKSKKQQILQQYL